MLQFIKNAFRGIFSFLLWMVLIAAATIGYNFGKTFSSDYGGFLGVVCGVLIGIFINIVFGGLIATFLSIDINLEKINDQLYTIRQKNLWVEEEPLQFDSSVNLKEESAQINSQVDFIEEPVQLNSPVNPEEKNNSVSYFYKQNEVR